MLCSGSKPVLTPLLPRPSSAPAQGCKAGSASPGSPCRGDTFPGGDRDQPFPGVSRGERLPGSEGSGCRGCFPGVFQQFPVPVPVPALSSPPRELPLPALGTTASFAGCGQRILIAGDFGKPERQQWPRCATSGLEHVLEAFPWAGTSLEGCWEQIPAQGMNVQGWSCLGWAEQ